MRQIIALIIISMNFFAANSIIAKETIVLDAAKKELNRFMNELKDEANPPYFIAYGITDKEELNIQASFGKILNFHEKKLRTLDIDLRIGDYNFDNKHIIRGESFSFFFRSGATMLPIENDEVSLRNAIWIATERKYKDARKQYEKALTNFKVKVKEEDSSADFSHEQPNKYYEPKQTIAVDKDKWRTILKNVSQIFANENWIYTGMVSLRVSTKTKYFVNSEGAELQMNEPYARIFISAKTKADDGMSLPLYKSFFAFDPKDLPDEKTLMDETIKIIETLKALREAPMMVTYSGPAMLSGEASGVFFHEIFGHRVEGHRLKDPKNAQTYKNSIDEEVLPKFLNVIFDPTRRKVNNLDVSGYFKFDDEGVKAQKVEVVQNGIFKNFLMSRAPIENFDKSNGHGRRQEGYSAVSRQSNLIVEASEKVSINELKDMLREECKKQDKEYGLYFTKVQGGFTFTGRTIPNSFNVNPLIVYKIFVDGSPDELVRGVDLIGTPLTTFSNIVAAGDDSGIFNGTCGAESGGVHVSAVSPTLLVSKIEVQKKSKSQAKLPLLPAPGDGKNQ